MYKYRRSGGLATQQGQLNKLKNPSIQIQLEKYRAY